MPFLLCTVTMVSGVVLICCEVSGKGRQCLLVHTHTVAMSPCSASIHVIHLFTKKLFICLFIHILKFLLVDKNCSTFSCFQWLRFIWFQSCFCFQKEGHPQIYFVIVFIDKIIIQLYLLRKSLLNTDAIVVRWQICLVHCKKKLNEKSNRQSVWSTLY